MRVDGGIDVQLKINGVTVPYTPSNTILANMNVNVSLPSFRINLLDPSGVFDRDLPLNDGTLLEMSIGDDRSEPRQANFRIFGTPNRRPGPDNIGSYMVHGILDAIPYIRSNPVAAINGTASQAIKTIADNVGFKLNNNASTNDLMNWLPGRNTWNGFAERLARHGWVDETSALHIGVDLDKTLHFHDITQLFTRGQIKKHFFHGDVPKKPLADLIAAEEYSAENHSGMMNNTYGYGLRMPQVDMLTGQINKLANVKAMTLGNGLIDMSKTILSEINGRGRIDIPRIMTGNSHPMYIGAEHQNKRIKSTYSQVVHVLVSAVTGLTLFDMVQLSVSSNGSSDDSVSGLYCVTALSAAAKGRRYKEKIQLTSSGPQNNNVGLV